MRFLPWIQLVRLILTTIRISGIALPCWANVGLLGINRSLKRQAARNAVEFVIDFFEIFFACCHCYQSPFCFQFFIRCKSDFVTKFSKKILFWQRKTLRHRIEGLLILVIAIFAAQNFNSMLQFGQNEVQTLVNGFWTSGQVHNQRTLSDSRDGAA